MNAAQTSSIADPLEDSSDEQLVLAAQDGDLDAFDEIMRRYQTQLWSFLHKFCPHQSELEDLVQAAFIKAYQNLQKWRPNGKFKGWLLRVAVNTGYDYYRKRRKEPIAVAQRSETENDQEPLDLILLPEEGESDHPNADLIERVLMDLKPEDRLLVTLHYYEGFSLVEIASQLEWSVSKTKVKIHRTRKQLEEVLKQHGFS